ncbi:uncharacterized protein METZ01_LOCUS507505, partial [marine metagenome]
LSIVNFSRFLYRSRRLHDRCARRV